MLDSIRFGRICITIRLFYSIFHCIIDRTTRDKSLRTFGNTTRAELLLIIRRVDIRCIDIGFLGHIIFHLLNDIRICSTVLYQLLQSLNII